MMIRFASAFPLLVVALAAQTQLPVWSAAEDFPTRLMGLVFDAAHQRLLGVEGLPPRVWSFDGTAWRRHRPDGLELGLQAQPMFRDIELVGYDIAHGVPVATRSGQLFVDPPRTFVGRLGGFEPNVGTSSPQLKLGGVACDPVSGQLLAFGGLDAFYIESDAMYAWNGSTWNARNPSLRPSPRSGHGMALDPGRGRVVLFGGSSAMQGLADTWEYDGANWQQQVPSFAPSARTTALAYDAARQRIVMVGGASAGPIITALSDTYEWNGANWSASGSLPMPMSALACSDGTTVVIASVDGELLRRSGTGWTVLSSRSRPQLWNAAVAYDPAGGQVLTVQAQLTGSTLGWNGSWQVRRANGAPGGIPARGAAAMAPLGNGLILFGGADSSSPLLAMFDQTWQWNGQSWAQLQPAHAPSPRYGHAMTATGNTILLFGGRDLFGVVDDTWSFDGVDWTQLQPVHAPAPRSGAALAYDTVQQRTLLFGGSSASTVFADTWEWDGQDWIGRTPQSQPAGGDFSMASTPNGVLLAADYLFRWDGTDWVQVDSQPLWAYAAELVYDLARQRTVMLSSYGEVQVFGVTPPGAGPIGTACGNATGLRIVGRPGVGCTPDVHLEAAPNSLAFTIYGLQLQTTSWGIGCTQFVRADALAIGSTDVLGHLDLPLVIPAALDLRGVQIYAQSLVLDGGPLFGGSVSAALQIAIGD